MSESVKKYGLWAIKILAGLAFLAAGLAKLVGSEMMVATYETIGWGQWFRYLTGLIEVSGAIALLVPRFSIYGALALAATMIGAIAAHFLVLGPSAVPAAVLLVITGTIAYAHRRDLPI